MRLAVSFEQGCPSIIPPMKSPTVGFTLIELLVAITVAGILAAIAIPAFNNFVMNDRDATQINSLATSLNYARSIAVKLNTQGGVEVCRRTMVRHATHPREVGPPVGWCST